MQESDYLDYEKAQCGWFAAQDAEERSTKAFQENMAFFDSPQHQSNIDKVVDIVESFFVSKKAVYINHRSNRNKPFTVVKVERPEFPRISFAKRAAGFRTPLTEMGVEIKQTQQGFLLRIYN